MLLYYTKGHCRLLSGVCHTTVRRRKGNDLVGPFRYNYYCGPTKGPALIEDPVFKFCYNAATEQDQAFIQDQL